MLDTLLTEHTIYDDMWDFKIKNKRRIRGLTYNLREKRLKKITNKIKKFALANEMQ